MNKAKLIMILWIVGLVIVTPILFFIGGWSLVLAYFGCKITGVCPI